MNTDKYAPNCIQNAPRCDWWPDCRNCGFDRDEDARRRSLLASQGLSKAKKGRKKGLRTLKIRRDENGR